MIREASSHSAGDVLAQLRTGQRGLTPGEARSRLARYGPNAVASHQARLLPVLGRQLRSPLLALLLGTAVASYFVGERSDAVIIAVILALSVGLGFVNEYRAERTAAALHSRIRYRCIAIRGGVPTPVPVTELVPGDIVQLRLGDVVPADIRLMETNDLECDESVLTGESVPVAKVPEPVTGTTLAELSNCALMGTVVRAGAGRGIVMSTGARTEFGAIAAGLTGRPLETEFQVGMRRFSMLLVYVAAALTTVIFVGNVVLHRPVIDALLFSLAIAVGITPQLLPAVVSTSLAAGSRRLAQRNVLVKRLVCIEDLGDVDVLLTDKTGTLTQGQIAFMRAVPAPGQRSETVLRWGLLATDTPPSDGRLVGANALDEALWDSPAASTARQATSGYARLATLPFDHQRRMVSVLVQSPDGATTMATKGAPEAVLQRCVAVPGSLRGALRAEYTAGNRVIAVATRPAEPSADLDLADEHDLQLAGLLVFLDPPKPDAAAALRQLASLGITVQVLTGDSVPVAVKICHDLGLPAGSALSGADLDALDDTALASRLAETTVFARVGPEQKARIVRLQRRAGHDVAFLGDGVNDALALHAADVGISVDAAADVAKDAADVILLEKDLGVLADGVAEGRRIFANTIKYVLMGTSSNFGNMFSAAGASLFLTFLPMLPSQILLNNLLYDAGQLTIPTDNVDDEQLRRPSHWDIGFIRRFMLYFGPISSLFDFATFAVLLWGLHAGVAEFRSGWFIESLATQTLVIFAIRTRRVPFFRSHPSTPLTWAELGVVAVGALLPITPLARWLGFAPLPPAFFAALVALVVCYLAIIETSKRWFYRTVRPTPPAKPRTVKHTHHQRRRASRFISTVPPLPANRPRAPVRRRRLRDTRSLSR